MKPTLLYILLLTCFTATAQPYSDITNNIKGMRLKGKVKEMHITERDTNSKKHKRTTIEETILRFSAEGRLMEKVEKKKKKTTTTSYQYLQEEDGKKLTVYVRYSRKPKRIDTIVYHVINDTLTRGYLLKKGEEHYPKRFIYNNKQQLIATIYPPSKHVHEYKIVQRYNGQGYMTERSTIADGRTFSTNNFIVAATDKQGNPTHIKKLYDSYTCHYTLKGVKHITYTYYE